MSTHCAIYDFILSLLSDEMKYYLCGFAGGVYVYSDGGGAGLHSSQILNTVGDKKIASRIQSKDSQMTARYNKKTVERERRDRCCKCERF